jgi:hypothetical protein
MTRAVDTPELRAQLLSLLPARPAIAAQKLKISNRAMLRMIARMIHNKQVMRVNVATGAHSKGWHIEIMRYDEKRAALPLGFRASNPNGLRCPSCRSSSIKRLSNQQQLVCKYCGEHFTREKSAPMPTEKPKTKSGSGQFAGRPIAWGYRWGVGAFFW